MVRWLWLVVILAACGKHAAKDPAPCDLVGGKVQTLAKFDLAAVADLPPATRHDAELELGPLKDEVARSCRDTHWPLDVRTCMVGATTGDALKACAASLTPEQRGALPEHKSGTP